MKKLVVSKLPTQSFVEAKKFDPRKFYGVNIDGARGLLTRARFLTGRFTTICPYQFTNGNSLCAVGAADTNDFTKLVAHLEDKGGTVYEFTSLMELVDWAGRGTRTS